MNSVEDWERVEVVDHWLHFARVGANEMPLASFANVREPRADPIERRNRATDERQAGDHAPDTDHARELPVHVQEVRRTQVDAPREDDRDDREQTQCPEHSAHHDAGAHRSQRRHRSTSTR